MDINWKIFIHPSYTVDPPPFFEKYDMVNTVVPGDERFAKRSLKGYSSRTCRFCGFSYPDVSFSNYSHLLPQLIGNRDLYSDFECDECNATFSKFENDLAGFLGMSRSISGLFGERKNPSFEAPRMKAKSRTFMNDKILIVAPEDIKVEGNTTKISYTKNPYTPANVYKALLKSAISLLDITEIENQYKHAIECLKGNLQITQGAVVFCYHFPFEINMPLHVVCFRKRVEAENIPDHVMCFYFQNHIISFPLPVSAVNSVQAEDWTVFFPPPFFFNEKSANCATPESILRDLSSSIPVLDEEETMSFQHNAKDLEDAWCYNPNTNTQYQEQYNPAESKHLIIARKGVTVDPKMLSDYVKEQLGEE